MRRWHLLPKARRQFLVDADLRMPAVHRIFSDAEGARRHIGLLGYLWREMRKWIGLSWRDRRKTFRSSAPEARTTNPGELLGADGFVTLMKTLIEKFDRDHH